MTKKELYGNFIIALAIIIALLLVKELIPLFPQDYVTGSEWEIKLWNLDNGSVSRLENGTFYGTAIKHDLKGFGTASIQQGDMPHKWYNSSARLKREITIHKHTGKWNPPLPLYLSARVKRTGPIEWYSSSPNRWNNIGLDIMGDVGLDYYNESITQPHALVIDFYHDTDATQLYYYQGAAPYDQDYRAGIPLVTSRLEVGKEYVFKTRIDEEIRDALNYYGFDYFTVKYTEYYIEAKASNGSVLVYDIALTTS